VLPESVNEISIKSDTNDDGNKGVLVDAFPRKASSRDHDVRQDTMKHPLHAWTACHLGDQTEAQVAGEEGLPGKRFPAGGQEALTVYGRGHEEE
jgi:hypothetical protein